MKRKRKMNYGRTCFWILLIIVVIALGCNTVSHFFSVDMDKLSEDISTPLSGREQENALPAKTQEPVVLDSSKRELHSPYALLVRLKDKKVAFEARSRERIYPASLTKIMTAVVAIENISDLQELVELPKKIFPDLYKADASMAGFLPGEKVPAIDLLYGALLPSGAEASIGLALKVSGSESKFVKRMNEKAKQFGMDDTHFTNVCGLHDSKHYTTAKDMAALLEYALKNKTFRKVFTASRHSTAGTNLHPDGITFYSTLFGKMEDSEFPGGKILGGKTGYTEESGLCLASLAEKNGVEYILITAGAPGDHRTEQYNIKDALMVYGNYLKK